MLIEFVIMAVRLFTIVSMMLWSTIVWIRTSFDAIGRTGIHVTVVAVLLVEPTIPTMQPPGASPVAVLLVQSTLMFPAPPRNENPKRFVGSPVPADHENFATISSRSAPAACACCRRPSLTLVSPRVS